jgi:hypothetical protein
MSCNLRCLNHKVKILALAESARRLRKKLKFNSPSAVAISGMMNLAHG